MASSPEATLQAVLPAPPAPSPAPPPLDVAGIRVWANAALSNAQQLRDSLRLAPASTNARRLAAVIDRQQRILAELTRAGV